MNTPHPRLFSPLQIGPLALANRIMVSPMCQYSAKDGSPVDWHFAHLGSLAMSGAGLLCLEATAVSAQGRITPGCLGLYSDRNEQDLLRLVQFLRSISPVPLALQLSHAGRKASSHAPWQGGSLIAPEDGGWTPLAPSAIAHKPQDPPPKAMVQAEIDEVIAAFGTAAARARAIGFDAIELHMAHGYLLHQFLSPVANQRTDAYGGSLDNRMRLALEVFRAVREEAGPALPVGVRLSATDWVKDGWDLEQTVQLARRLEAGGCAFLDISSGGVSHQQKIEPGPGYQVPFAAAVKAAVDIPVITVGMITEPAHAQQILRDGQADMVALARGFLNDPRWPWRAAAQTGGSLWVPPPLHRALPSGHPPIFQNV